MTTATITSVTKTIKGKKPERKKIEGGFWSSLLEVLDLVPEPDPEPEPDKIIPGFSVRFAENGKEKKQFLSDCDRREAVNYLLQKGFNASKAEIAKFITCKIKQLVLFHN